MEKMAMEQNTEKSAQRRVDTLASFGSEFGRNNVKQSLK
jgi:hypothetical protein